MPWPGFKHATATQFRQSSSHVAQAVTKPGGGTPAKFDSLDTGIKTDTIV